MAKRNSQQLTAQEVTATRGKLVGLLTDGLITADEYKTQLDKLQASMTALKQDDRKENGNDKKSDYNPSDDKACGEKMAVQGYDVAMMSYRGYEPRLYAKAGQYGKGKALPLPLCDWLRGLTDSQYTALVGNARAVAKVADTVKTKNPELAPSAQAREQDKTEIQGIKSDIATLSTAVAQLVASLKSK
jgi:hypothetical protein